MMCHFWPTEAGQKGEVRGRHIAVPVPEWPADIYSGKCPHTAAAIEKGTHVSCQIWFNEPKPELPHRHMGVSVRWDCRKTLTYLKQRFRFINLFIVWLCV